MHCSLSKILKQLLRLSPSAQVRRKRNNLWHSLAKRKVKKKRKLRAQHRSLLGAEGWALRMVRSRHASPRKRPCIRKVASTPLISRHVQPSATSCRRCSRFTKYAREWYASFKFHRKHVAT